MAVGRFYAGVGAVVWSPKLEQYLLLKRADDKDYAPGTWECPTGRVDQGEGFEEALHREVQEELGIDLQVIHILGTTHFYRGEEKPENELVGVIYLCTVEDPTQVRISSEHSELRWLSAVQAIELLTSTDTSSQWAKRVIQRAEIVRRALPGELADFQQKSGFELG
jgi:8-oxo-dGTP pyrophosphatase MutT (NUDIX family)